MADPAPVSAAARQPQAVPEEEAGVETLPAGVFDFLFHVKSQLTRQVGAWRVDYGTAKK